MLLVSRNRSFNDGLDWKQKQDSSGKMRLFQHTRVVNGKHVTWLAGEGEGRAGCPGWQQEVWRYMHVAACTVQGWHPSPHV